MPLIQSVLDGIKNGANHIPGFFEEAQVARYVALADTAGGFTVPDAQSPIPVSDRHFTNIAAAGIVDDTPATLTYRTSHTGNPHFTVRINPTHITNRTLSDKDTGFQTWTEIVPAGLIKPTNNEIVFGVSGEGAVTFSDVVIFYTSNQLTVKKQTPPPVVSQN